MLWQFSFSEEQVRRAIFVMQEPSKRTRLKPEICYVLLHTFFRLSSLSLLFSNFIVIFMSRYGVGYHLTLVKRESCDQDAVTKLVKHYVPTAEIVSSVGAELQFVLSSEHAQQFEILFSELESK